MQIQEQIASGRTAIGIEFGSTRIKAVLIGEDFAPIASSIIGGTMLTGGVGNIIGTLFGVMSLALIQTIVQSVGLDQAWWTGITIAAMLCLFLIVQSIIIARRKKANASSAR